jgi:hypothetical protein
MESLDLGSPPLERDTPAVQRRMLIVTADSLADAFIPLAQRRFDEGIVTSIVSMSQVASWPGRDDAEKLRNYVIQFRLEQGLDYLLLGGDTNLVPYRKAYAMTCEAGFHPREDSLPCDLYYADLDGNLLIANDPYEGVRVVNGKLVLPDRPGLGLRPRSGA